MSCRVVLLVSSDALCTMHYAVKYTVIDPSIVIISSCDRKFLTDVSFLFLGFFRVYKCSILEKYLHCFSSCDKRLYKQRYVSGK